MIETTSFEYAKSAAQAISYLTGSPVTVQVSSTDSSKWIIESEFDFFAAIFVLRFESAQPPNAPIWWEELTEKYWSYKDQWDLLSVVTKALTLPFERNPGEAPTFTGKDNTFALDAIAAFSDKVRPHRYWPEGNASNRHVLKWEFDKKIAYLLFLGIDVLKITFNLEEDCEGESYEITTLPESAGTLQTQEKMNGLAEMLLEFSKRPTRYEGELEVSIATKEQLVTYQHFDHISHDRDCFTAKGPLKRRGVSTAHTAWPSDDFTDLGDYASLTYCRPRVANLLKGYFSFLANEDKTFSANNLTADAYDVGGYHYQNDPVGTYEKQVLSRFFSAVVNDLAKPEPKGEERLLGSFSINYLEDEIAFSIVYSYWERAADTAISFSFEEFVANSENEGAKASTQNDDENEATDYIGD